MKGLRSLSPVFAAKQLREILLIKDVSITERDGPIINAMPNLQAFAWEALDIPLRRSEPVRNGIRFASAEIIDAAD